MKCIPYYLGSRISKKEGAFTPLGFSAFFRYLCFCFFACRSKSFFGAFSHLVDVNILHILYIHIYVQYDNIILVLYTVSILNQHARTISKETLIAESVQTCYISMVSITKLEKLGIVLHESLLRTIDSKRGAVPRSRYIQRLYKIT